MDVDSIALGRDFRQTLQERLGSCDLMLALIGPIWLDAKDGSGNRRLESPTDFVRQEIAAALKRNIPVIPVLLQGAQMPAPERLPEDIRDLAYRNGFELSHNRWESDVNEMVKRLGLRSPETPQKSPPLAAGSRVKYWIAGGGAAVLAFAVWMLLPQSPVPASDSSKAPETPATAVAGNLLVNGSFEEPPVQTGGFILEATPGTFGGWTVVGAPGDVASVSGLLLLGGINFPAQNGQQWMDLTGTTNSATGIEQVVTTRAGTTYDLSFHVGNVIDPVGFFGVTSTVEVFADGRSLGAVTNSDGSTEQNWRRFTLAFTATSASTKITFMNRDTASDNSNGLDDVVLTVRGGP